MLVDTSVWIDYLNGHESAEAIRLHRGIADNEPIRLCGIILTEILLGLRSDQQASKIENLLSAFDWLPEPDHKDYSQAARIYRTCRSQGITIGSTIDCLIATLCIQHSLAILSKDRDFARIATCHPLSLVIT